MYGCAEPYLVYGFNFNCRKLIFDYKWLDENYPEVECYAVDIVRNYLGEPIYGVGCKLDVHTGQIIGPSEEKKQIVKKLYDKYVEYFRTEHGKTSEIKLGYHLAVAGWDEQTHKQIRL